MSIAHFSNKSVVDTTMEHIQFARRRQEEDAARDYERGRWHTPAEIRRRLDRLEKVDVKKVQAAERELEKAEQRLAETEYLQALNARDEARHRVNLLRASVEHQRGRLEKFLDEAKTASPGLLERMKQLYAKVTKATA